MEATRKGRFLANAEKAERWLKLLCDSNVPLWYIDSLSKIRYLTTRAHVAHYTKLAVTMAWFKVHYPEEFCNAVLKNGEHYIVSYDCFKLIRKNEVKDK